MSATALQKASLALGGIPADLADTTQLFGQTTDASLESISFRISRISLCGHLSLSNGTGTSCQGAGEWTIYTGDTSDDYNTFLPEQAKSDTTHYTNFLDAEAMKALGRSVTYSDDNAQTYDSVLVYWYRPFKIKGSVPMSDGSTTLYTKANGTFRSNGKDGLAVNYQTDVTDMTTGPAEEGTFFLPNGGTFFYLPQKFEITKGDVDKKTNFKMVFAFDPSGMVKGSSWNGQGNSDGYLSGMGDATAGFRIDSPFLQIAPVVARDTETVMREVYLLRSSDSKMDVRLSLYYVKEDATKSIRAVTTTTLYNAATDGNSLPGDWAQINSVETTADGKVNFKDYTGTNVIQGLVRTETPGPLDASIDHIQCNSFDASSAGSGCPTGSTTTIFSAALVGIGAVDSTITATYQAPEPSQ